MAECYGDFFNLLTEIVNGEHVRDIALKEVCCRQGSVPSGPMSDDPTPKAVALPTKTWARRKSLENVEIH